MANRRRAQEHGLSWLNNRFAATLVFLALASAVPLASNRPSWWLLWTAVIGLLGMSYHVIVWRLIPGREPRIKPLAGFFLCAAVVPGYAMLQAQEIGNLLPTSFMAGLTHLKYGMQAMVGRTVSVVPDASMIGGLRYFGYLILLTLVIEICSRRDRVGWMSHLIFAGIVLQAIWALVALKLLGDIAIFGQKTAYLGMATGTFVNRNSLATFLGFGLVLGAALIGRRFECAPTRTSRPLGPLQKLGVEGQLVLVAMLMIFLALLATQSRLGLAASLSGLTATLLLLCWWRGRLSPWVWAAIMPCALALAAVAIALSGQGVSDRAIFSEVDGTTRLELYRQILRMIVLRPWTGFGFDGFGPAFEAFRSPPLNGQTSFDMAHNSYLTLWSEQGLVIGSITPLLLFAAVLIMLQRLRRDTDFPANAAGAIGALLLGAVHSMGDFSLEIPANNYVLLIILGMGLAHRSASGPSSGSSARVIAKATVRLDIKSAAGVPLTKAEDDPA